jgi:aspartyl-tRNA(Asn)/glutamyl-tRNA(Gln) amidotransferase subunit B
MTTVHYEAWEPVIGLEIHVQLLTKTKLFSAAPCRFGAPPNTLITEIDTGQPGSLPMLNQEAVRLALQFGLAIRAEIALISGFDRKSYFYPDNPRNFQITQFYRPLIRGGTITCDIAGHTRHFAIERAHLEDDTGMLKHVAGYTGIDYNRAGAPLLEIVSEPMIHSPKEAVAYAMAIKALMQYLGASDCNMEKGSLRIDANVSVRPKGSKGLRPKAEIKNMNSFHYMELAIEAEIRRQIRLYTLQPHEDPKVLLQQATYRFDPVKKESILMRRKEEAQDYRYFPEPDLPPLVLTEQFIEAQRLGLPELPHQRYLRYISDLQLSPGAASALVGDKFLSDYFEEALKVCGLPSALCNWLIAEFAGRLKEKGSSLQKSGLLSRNVGKLVKLIHDQVITGKMGKLIADEMVKHPERDPEEIVRDNPNYQPLQDAAAIEPIVEEVLQAHPASIADYKAGKIKALAFLVGQVMEKTGGKASPAVVNALIQEKLDGIHK